MERTEKQMENVWGDENKNEMDRICKNWVASGLQALSTHSN